MTLVELYNEFVLSKGISTDTRQKVNGTLFFALRGDRFDGNRYVEDAIQAGCRLAITERKELKGEAGVCYTPSALELLQKLASHHRDQVSPRVLAITGSNGKTTTKELVFSVLSKGFSVLATKGNLNNHIGVPLTLLSLDNEEVAVVEMGANHPGEIETLAKIAAPDVGLITNVGKAHLEGFGSLQGVLNAKGELYDYLAASGGVAIVDREDTRLLRKAKKTGVTSLTAGEGGGLPLSVSLLDQSPYLDLELKIRDEVYRVKTGIVGVYNLQNIKLAAACGEHFGIPGQDIADAIASYSPENQRSQVVEGEYNRVILDSYNANPTSMREAVGGLTAYADRPPVVILGDMAELGATSLQEHEELVQWIKSLPLERVLVVGPQFARVSEPLGDFLVFKGIDDLRAYLKQYPLRGYTILVKGSRVMGLERLEPLLVSNSTNRA